MPPTHHIDWLKLINEQVRGSVLGSGPYIDSSDRRLKQDIHPLQSDTLARVMQLHGV